MNEYTDCYVAFLDILGFRTLLKNESFDTIKQIFENIKEFEPRPLLKGCKAFDCINYYIMSDSVVIYIDSSIEDSFMALSEVCLQIQIRLTTLDTPILMRGAIAKGSLFCEGNVIFGNGLSDAYEMESTLAKYPRVIFTNSVREVALQNTGKQYVLDSNSMLYTKDDDCLYYINYLNIFDYSRFISAKTVSDFIDFDIEHFDKLVNYVENRLGTETNSSIRDKYIWLRKKILDKIDHMPEVKKHFEEIEKKRYEERVKRFDAALHTGKSDD